MTPGLKTRNCILATGRLQKLATIPPHDAVEFLSAQRMPKTSFRELRLTTRQRYSPPEDADRRQEYFNVCAATQVRGRRRYGGLFSLREIPLLAKFVCPRNLKSEGFGPPPLAAPLGMRLYPDFSRVCC